MYTLQPLASSKVSGIAGVQLLVIGFRRMGMVLKDDGAGRVMGMDDGAGRVMGSRWTTARESSRMDDAQEGW